MTTYFVQQDLAVAQSLSNHIHKKRSYKKLTQVQKTQLIRLTRGGLSRNQASIKVGIPKSTGKKFLKDLQAQTRLTENQRADISTLPQQNMREPLFQAQTAYESIWQGWIIYWIIQVPQYWEILGTPYILFFY